MVIGDELTEVTRIKDEPLDPSEECFSSVARDHYSNPRDHYSNPRDHYSDPRDNYINPLNDELFNQPLPGDNQNCNDNLSNNSDYDNRADDSVSNSSYPASQSTQQSNTQTDTHTNTQTDTQTNKTRTVIRSYSLANIPKCGDDGRLLTLGQRLALIQKKHEEERMNSSEATSSCVGLIISSMK